MIEEVIEIKSEERSKLLNKYQDKLDVDAFLSRKIVSFQANKKTPIYRWFKYKEGFSEYKSLLQILKNELFLEQMKLFLYQSQHTFSY